MKWDINSYGVLCGILKENENDNILPDGLTVIGKKIHVIIPDGVKTIEWKLFHDWESLNSVVICEGIESIGSWAFSRCTNLEKIEIPSSLRIIGAGAFESCSALKEVILPENLTRLQSSAFENCVSLQRVTIPNACKEISRGTFKNCSNLKEVILPEDLTRLGEGAFENCVSLQRVTIPSACKEISSDTFKNCSNLTEVIINFESTNISGGAFDENVVNRIPELKEYYKRIVRHGECGPLVFWKKNKGGELFITGNGCMEDYQYKTGVPYYEKPSSRGGCTELYSYLEPNYREGEEKLQFAGWRTEYKIPYVFFSQEHENWLDFGDIYNRSYNGFERGQVFYQCPLNSCTTYNDKKLYRCGRSSYLNRNDVIETVMIDVSKIVSRREMRKKIHKFYSASYLKACNYCNKKPESIVPGIQINNL